MSCSYCQDRKSQSKHKKQPVLGEGASTRISRKGSNTFKGEHHYDMVTHLRTAMASSIVLASTDPSSSTRLLMFSSKGTSK